MAKNYWSPPNDINIWFENDIDPRKKYNFSLKIYQVVYMKSGINNGATIYVLVIKTCLNDVLFFQKCWQLFDFSSEWHQIGFNKVEYQLLGHKINGLHCVTMLFDF